MFDVATDTSAATDPADARVEGRMALLREMAEIGLHQARRLDRQSELAAIYSDTCAVPEHLQPPYARRLDEIARAFAQLSRAVSLAVALEDRIDADHRAGPAAAAERALRRQLLALRVQATQAQTVPTAAKADSGPSERHTPETPTPTAKSDPRVRLDRLLNADLAELDAWLRRPPEEVISHIRQELGLEAGETPDTPRSSPSGGNRAASAGRGGPPGSAPPPPHDPPQRNEASGSPTAPSEHAPASPSGQRPERRPLKRPPRPDRDRNPLARAEVSPD